MDKCNDTIRWLDANQTAEVEEYKDKQKEVEGVCNPIIQKLYQGAGGGAPPPQAGGAGGPSYNSNVNKNPIIIWIVFDFIYT